jgi:hypothetical protein
VAATSPSVNDGYNPCHLWTKSRPSISTGYGFESAVLLIVGEHIPINRAWVLIEDTGRVSGAEAKHLETCDDCREFLRSFVSVARYIGLSVRFPTQEYRLDDEHAA